MWPMTNELRQIEQAMKEVSSKLLYRRYQVIYLHLQGYKNVEIARIVSLTPHTVGIQIKKYKENGLDGLLPLPKPGCPRKLSPEQEAELIDTVINKTPTDIGIEPYMTWDCKLLCIWVKQTFGVSFSKGGVRDMLLRLGFSYTRPTYSLAKASQEKQKEFIQTFEELKNLIRGEIDHLLFQDESSIRDYQSLVSNWFLKGKQRIIPTYGKHQSVKLIGVLNYEPGHVYVQEEERYTADIFLDFLKNVLKQYPTGKIVIILDNARIHHAKLIQPFLEEHKSRLKLVFLPPYIPELNLIEGLWKWLKKSVIHNVFYKSVTEIKKAVQGFFESINQRPIEVIRRLREKMYIIYLFIY
ncbi:MAG: IS630 family transposase, partial [Turicibacter sp.]|nr:IS630 family transposase [Turicibacter sp.]